MAADSSPYRYGVCRCPLRSGDHYGLSRNTKLMSFDEALTLAERLAKEQPGWEYRVYEAKVILVADGRSVTKEMIV